MSARGMPFGQYEYVEVVFELANADKIIPHTLTPNTPKEIDYVVMGKSTACDVYHDVGLDARPWGRGYVVLRCTQAGAAVTLLLTTRS